MPNNVAPDPKQRRRARILLLAAIILGVFAIRMAYDYTDHLKALAGLDPEVSLAGMQKLSLILLCANALVSSIFAIYFLWLARRVRQDGQFPPRNMKVLRAARIQTGTGAKAIALLCLVIALLLLSTNIFMWRFHRMLTDLGKRQSAIPLDQQGTAASHRAQFTGGRTVLPFDFAVVNAANTHLVKESN